MPPKGRCAATLEMLTTTPREAEYAYFMSDEFAADLDRQGLRLVRWDGRLVTAPVEQRTSSASG